MQKESSVIAVLLRHPEEILKQNILPKDFESDFYAEALHVMRKVAASGVEVDVLSVSDQMDDREALARLAALQKDGMGVKSNLGAYILQVKKQAKARKLKKIISEAMTLSDEVDANPDKISAELITAISEEHREENTKVFDSKQMMRSTIDHIEEMFELKMDGKMSGVPSGLGKLDTLLGGFHKSDLVVVGARPGMGKTSWAVTCAVNAAKQGFKVGFVSTEMSVVQLGMRISSLVSGIPAHKMRDSSFSDTDWTALANATAKIFELPLFIYDQPSCSVSDIAIQARAWAMSDGLDIIFVDYLTRLKPDGNAENRVLAVGDIATGLKTLARNLNIPVVALAQLSREVTKRSGSIPQMSDLRDSGVIEQEADQILMLYRAVVYDANANDNDANIIVEKNRHGDVAMLNMGFKKEIMRWSDPIDDYYA